MRSNLDFCFLLIVVSIGMLNAETRPKFVLDMIAFSSKLVERGTNKLKQSDVKFSNQIQSEIDILKHTIDFIFSPSNQSPTNDWLSLIHNDELLQWHLKQEYMYPMYSKHVNKFHQT